jgi:hypothetical protein
MKKTGWSPCIFLSIDWDVQEQAFGRKARHKQSMLAKLILGLANINSQNHQYYGQSALCPICHMEEETFEHFL